MTLPEELTILSEHSCSPQLLEEVEASLSFLGQRYSIVGTGEALSDVHSQELGVAAPSMVSVQSFWFSPR